MDGWMSITCEEVQTFCHRKRPIPGVYKFSSIPNSFVSHLGFSMIAAEKMEHTGPVNQIRTLNAMICCTVELGKESCGPGSGGNGGVESRLGGESAGVWPYLWAINSKGKCSKGECSYAKTEIVLTRPYLATLGPWAYYIAGRATITRTLICSIFRLQCCRVGCHSESGQRVSQELDSPIIKKFDCPSTNEMQESVHAS